MNIENEVQSAMPEILRRIKEEAISRIEREAVNEATKVCVEAAKAWAIEVLVPEIRAQLDSSKGEMVKAAQAAAEGVGEAVKNALIENAKKHLSSSWNVQQAAKSIFG
jgi:hypothetical protein